uniref:Uncharacterized protein n=1 Tax=Lepeophtheirus salmonis TaxID=72036 RepID=A0A0K2TQB0_LEPSM
MSVCLSCPSSSSSFFSFSFFFESRPATEKSNATKAEWNSVALPGHGKACS